MLGSFKLRRQPLPKSRWPDPESPRYAPNWIARITIPEHERDDVSTRLPICDRCLAIAHGDDPVEERKSCKCHRAAASWARKELKARVALWREGREADLQRMAAPRTAPTIAELTDAYLEGVPERMADSAAENVRALCAIVAEEGGIPPEAVRSLRCDVLTRELALSWMRRRQWMNSLDEDERKRHSRRHETEPLPALDVGSAHAGNTTINSMMGKAKAVVGRKARSYYLPEAIAGRLPELKDFREMSRLPEEVGNAGLPRSVELQIRRLAAGWSVEAPEKWIAYVLMAGCGLRPIEVLAAQWDWIEEVDGERLLVIRNRDGFETKAKSRAVVRYFRMPAAFLELVDRRGDGPLFAPDMPAPKRDALLRREMSKELRAVLPAGYGGTNYALRKAFGSALYQEGGKEAARSGLGHATSDTAEKNYVADRRVTDCLV